MTKRAILILTVVLLFLALSVAGFAQAPLRQEQLIYSILAFNGRDYAGTFAREEADTLYLLAEVDNFLTVRKTLVYFWPITQDWKTDTSGLNIPFEGTLELLGTGRSGPAGEPRSLESTPYTYYNIRGDYEFNWVVAKSDEAEAAWQRYQEIMDAYWQTVQQYYQERGAYEAMLRELTTVITQMRDEGRDVSALVEVLRGMTAPPEPQYPRDYIVPPSPVSEAFILNLPVGEYALRFLTPEGELMQGSERRVVVFEKRRAEGVGLEVIPGDRWTRPVESKTPASVLYVDGSADLYLRPYFQQEYNDLYYEKMRQNDARGNPNLMKWVRIQQVPQAGIAVARPGQESRVGREQPFYVEQVRGAALGYRIVPFDPEGAHKDRDPSLLAFHVPLSRADRVVRLQVQDRDGESLKGGVRQIRVIRPARAGFVSLILALLPLAVMAFVLVRRSRVYSG